MPKQVPTASNGAANATAVEDATQALNCGRKATEATVIAMMETNLAATLTGADTQAALADDGGEAVVDDGGKGLTNRSTGVKKRTIASVPSVRMNS